MDKFDCLAIKRPTEIVNAEGYRNWNVNFNSCLCITTICAEECIYDWLFVFVRCQVKNLG